MPVATALITALATLGGVWITQSYSAKRERETRVRADLRESARRVSDLFLSEAVTIQQFITREESSAGFEFSERYRAHLYDGAFFEIAQAIRMVPDMTAREQCGVVLRALTDSKDFPSEFRHGPGWAFSAGAVASVGASLSSAYARGEKPDQQALRRFEDVADAMDRVEASRGGIPRLRP